MSPRPGEDPAQALARLRALAKDITAPGMSAVVQGWELGLLITRGDRAETELASERAVKAPPLAVSHDDAVVLLDALADAWESHPELWGEPVVEALGSWAAQEHRSLPAGWETLLAEDRP